MKTILKKRYHQQKSNAKLRGVEFLLSYDEWLAVWQQSGKLELRGRGAGKYCMCRYGDKGAYALGNVFIALNTQNISEGNLGRVIPPEVRAKISKTHSGVPHPWSAGEKNPMHRPEVKAKMAAAVGGANHYKARGVITPQGFFPTARAASESLGIPKATIEWRARYSKSGFSLPS